MKRKREGEEWHGKISYRNYKNEIKDPADVRKKIKEGTVYSILNISQVLKELLKF